ncbi:hypothetical protein DIPPA_30213 [Diplonema papillatum]|nr:hypothetical protein DIPPA_30213 [Diplonema papillatum]
MQTRTRGRTPGKSPNRLAAPPRDLWELRRACPNVKWGGNVPQPRREPEPEPEDKVDPGLPMAYLMATRSEFRSDHRSSYHRASTPPAATRRSSLGPSQSYFSSTSKPWNAGPTRWDRGTLAGNSGCFSTPHPLAVSRSSKSGTQGRPREKQRSKSPAAGAPGTPRVYGTPRPVFVVSAAPKGVTPGIGPFITSASPMPKPSRRRTSSRDRGTYSTAPRRRTPSPRPFPTSTARHNSERLAQAMHERASVELDLKAVYPDPMAAELSGDAAGPGLMLADQSEFAEQSSLLSAPPGTLVVSGGNGTSEASAAFRHQDDVFEHWTPLHWAAKEGSVSVLKALLERGSDLEARLPDGKTAFDVACDSLERAAVLGEDVEEKKEVLRLLGDASKAKKEKEDTWDFDTPLLGADMYVQLLRVLPRVAWETMVDMLPEDDLRRMSHLCRGMHALARPKIMFYEDERVAESREATAEDLAMAVNILNSFDPELTAQLTAGQPPSNGVLRLLQMVCMVLGNQWVDTPDTWPVAKYLLKTEVPMLQLVEKAGHRMITGEQARWLLSILDESANEIAVECDDFLGAMLTLIVCSLAHTRASYPHLPPLRLPEGFRFPTDRPTHSIHAVTTLRTV